MNVFGMLAQQTGVYVQLKIHVLLPLNQRLKSSLVVRFSRAGLVWIHFLLHRCFNWVYELLCCFHS